MLRAYHGDPAIKAQYLARVEAHRKADEIVQGQYWAEGKGCAVGCTIHGDDHFKYETELGIPMSLAWLEDKIFEGLPNAEAKDWPVRFLEAIPVGADLSQVSDRMQLWILESEISLSSHAFEDGKSAIATVADLYRRKLGGDTPTLEEWSAAESAAWSAARSAESAWSAARSAESAAWSAARSAESAARSAAWSARSARSARSAESAARSAAESARSAESAAWSAAWSAWSAESAAWSAAWRSASNHFIALILEVSTS